MRSLWLRAIASRSDATDSECSPADAREEFTSETIRLSSDESASAEGKGGTATARNTPTRAASRNPFRGFLPPCTGAAPYGTKVPGANALVEYRNAPRGKVNVRWRGFQSEEGRVTTNDDPRPSSLRASTRPPCCSATWRTIAKPSPVPPVSRE